MTGRKTLARNENGRPAAIRPRVYGDRRRERYALVCAVFLLSLGSSGAQTADLTAREILDRVEKLLWGRTNRGVYEMTIVTPDWQRTLVLRIWMDRPDKTLVRILAPAKDQGIGSLRIKTEMWNYLPKVARVIKIPPSMMLQSWMGSDFTNDDLVKESSVVNDYTHAILATESYEGTTAYKIEAIPKPEAPVVWGKLLYWVRQSDLIPLRQEYYNERDELVKYMIFADVRRLGGRVLPTRWEMRPVRKPGQETVIVLREVEFDRPLPANLFTLVGLRETRQ